MTKQDDFIKFEVIIVVERDSHSPILKLKNDQK